MPMRSTATACAGLALFALLTPAALLATPRGRSAREDFVEGTRLLREGRAAAALERLRAAETAAGAAISAGLLQNLALAAWQAGEAGAAESYAERAAAKDPGLVVLRDNLVGAVRLAEARAAHEARELARARERVHRAVQAFESALVAAAGQPTLRRNLARALRLEQEIVEAIQQAETQDEKPNEEPNEEPTEQQDEPDRAPSGSETQPDAAPAPPPTAPEPGQADPARELSPEQKQRLLQRLSELLLDARRRRSEDGARHRPGKKDW